MKVGQWSEEKEEVDNFDNTINGYIIVHFSAEYCVLKYIVKKDIEDTPRETVVLCLLARFELCLSHSRGQNILHGERSVKIESELTFFMEEEDFLIYLNACVYIVNSWYSKLSVIVNESCYILHACLIKTGPYF